MAGNMAVFDQKAPPDIMRLAFDYTSRLPTGVNLTSAGVSAQVWAGVDPNPNAIILGSTIVGAVVYQIVTGGVPGVIYKLTCFTSASNGENPIMYGYLAVVGDPL